MLQKVTREILILDIIIIEVVIIYTHGNALSASQQVTRK